MKKKSHVFSIGKLALILMIFHFSEQIPNEFFEESKIFLQNPTFLEKQLNKILILGEMNGLFTNYEFFDVIDLLSRQYPNQISRLMPVGKTFHNKEIKAFRLGDFGTIKRKQISTSSYFIHRSSSFSRSHFFNYDFENISAKSSFITPP